uniref:Immunoglobulin V-set domain-containing protein n=1 Tax=Anabas testudineus TaxID=64144 RepID=A0A3Q1KDZ3_ANATE
VKQTYVHVSYVISGYQHPFYRGLVELKDREKKEGDVSLILRNVTFNDTGTYECHVVQRGTNHRKRSILEKTVHVCTRFALTLQF